LRVAGTERTDWRATAQVREIDEVAYPVVREAERNLRGASAGALRGE